jgi:hypothetical protein
MFEIKYEIKLNDVGRPYIDFPKGYENNTEDKFFALELARYLLQSTYGRMTVPPYNKDTIEKMGLTITMLAQIGDEIAEMVWNQMKIMGEIDLMMNNNYHIEVNSTEERDAIPEKGYFHDGKIFNRQEGLKVRILNEDITVDDYELKGGITNENWEKIS